MAIFVILAIMAKLDMAINMGVMGVFLKRSQNADQTRKPFVNWSNGVKVMAKTKNFSDFMAICFVFWANISTGLWDPLGCSDLSQIFFGSSPIGIEWDKIVAEIIITTFVFFRHPTRPPTHPPTEKVYTGGTPHIFSEQGANRVV